MRDLINFLSAAYTLSPVTRSADASGTGVDLRGFESAAIYLEIGIGGITFDATNKIEFILQESDDDSTYTPVAQADILGVSGVANGIVRALTTVQAAASFTEVGYVGAKRYVRLVADFSGTHGTGTPIAALVVRGHAAQKPA